MRVRCKGKGGLLVLNGRAVDVKPGWTGEMESIPPGYHTFLEPDEQEVETPVSPKRPRPMARG